MSPRKQPHSLYTLSIKSCMSLINSACYIIEKQFKDDIEFYLCEQKAFALKCQLMSYLPARLFDVLCSQRICCRYRGDPRIQLQVLTHPNMSTFHKFDLDNGIPQRFWIENLPKFSKLVVLDLKFICTDEILQVIGVSCPLVEEINIVSRVDICKSPFNASVLIRNVSDAGLRCISSLKRLRLLAMDPPRNERANRVGRCVSQGGIIMLVSELPQLEELQIESCDIGSTLISCDKDIGPLKLRKINCHSASADGFKRLMKVCPDLKEFSVTHLSEHNRNAILDQISGSNLQLRKLDLSFFSFSNSMDELLSIKGKYLTHFSLWETDNSLTFDSLLTIGQCCPNLQLLCLMSESRRLIVPQFFTTPKNMFTELHTLTLGNENFNIQRILLFFLQCTNKLQRLVLQYQLKMNIDEMMLHILEKGYLRHVICLWLDCTLEVSKAVVKRTIESCTELQMFTVDCSEDMTDIKQHIHTNNLDLELGSY